MNLKQFVKKQKVNSELAEEAWEKAGGDPDKASRLLEPARLWFKGRFGESGRSGLFMVEWDFTEEEIKSAQVVILAGKKIKGASPRLSPRAFGKKIKESQKSSKTLEGPMAALEGALESAWQEKGSKIRKTLKENDYKRLRALHRPLLNDTLDFEVGEKEMAHTLRRHMDVSEEDDRVFIPCDISVNPVKGVSFSKLKKGDEILISLKDPGASSPEVRDAWRRAQKLADKKGFIPAELKSGKKSDSGKINLKLKIMPGVWADVTLSLIHI